MWTYETTRAGGYVTNERVGSTTNSFTASAGGTFSEGHNTEYSSVTEAIGFGGGNIGANTHREEGHVTISGPTSTQFSNITRITEGVFDGVVGSSSFIRYGTVDEWSTSFNFTDDDESGTFDVGPFNAISSSTSTVTNEQAVESTLTITYSVPTSATYSTTNSTTTSTQYPTTTSTTVTETILSSSSDTVTLTVSTTTDYTVPPNAVTDTVVIAESTDWLWSITTTGTSLASTIGTSFTQTTVTATEVSSLVPVSIVSYNDDTGDPPFSVPTSYTDTYFDTSSTTSTSTTMLTSSYSTGITTTNGATIPFTTNTETTINYVTSTAVDLIYNISSTSSFETFAPLYSNSSYSQEYTTTSAARGTFISITALTTRTFYRLYQIGTHDGFGQSITDISYDTILSRNAQASSNYPPAFSFNEAQPGPGFQAPSAMGYGHEVGTNISGGDIPLSWGSAWPDIATPLLSPISGTVLDGISTVSTQYVASDSAVFTTRTSMIGTDLSSFTGFFTVSPEGSMTTSTRTGIKTQTGNTVGGYGWYTGTDSFTTITDLSGKIDATLTSTYTDESGFPFPTTFTTTTTYTSEVSEPWGVHRITKQNSLGVTTTSYISWADSLTTYSIKRSEGIAFEPIAVAHGSNKTIAFSAYPGN